MKQPVLLAVLAFAGMAVAQRGPLPGLPVMPTVQHPALLAQPLLQPEQPKTAPQPKKAPNKAAPKKGAKLTKAQLAKLKKAKNKRAKVNADTRGVKVAGRELKERVSRVLKLNWRKKMIDLEAQSAATGKPILYLQALGSLDGFA